MSETFSVRQAGFSFSPLTEELRSLSEPHLDVVRDVYHNGSTTGSSTR